MKTTKLLGSVSLLLILIIAVSCRSSRNSTGGQYPRNPSPQTETSTNTYSVQTTNANLPPGQAKKIYGGQSAKAYAPGQRKKYALVIVYTPGIVISRHSDGRYYYINNEGYTYWKGNDGRYYIDETHLKEIEYEDGDYDDWKFKGQKNNNAREPKGKDKEETVKEGQKTKDTEHLTKVKEQKGMGQNPKEKYNDPKGKDQFNRKENDNDQKGKDQFNQKVKANDQKGKDQFNQKVKANDQKGNGQADQKSKDENQKEKDQSGQKAKDENQKEKDQTDQKGKAKSKDKA